MAPGTRYAHGTRRCRRSFLPSGPPRLAAPPGWCGSVTSRAGDGSPPKTAIPIRFDSHARPLRDAIDADDLAAALRANAEIVLLTAAQLSLEARTSVGEVLLTREGLDREAADVLATLLHEASHAIADQRGIKDTSRQGRYHNQRFKNIAEEIGLEVSRDRQIGWSLTSVSEATANAYSQPLAEIAVTLRAGRFGTWSSPAPRRADLAALVCECGRRTRDGRSVRFPAAAICGVCGCGDLQR